MPEKDVFRRALDNLPEGVYFVDRDRKITYWNRAASRITGFPAREVIGRGCYDNMIVHIDEKGKGICDAACPLRHVIDSGKECERELYLNHRDGYRVPVRLKAVPIKDRKGRITGAMEIFQDKTSDIYARKKIMELSKEALLDPLTNIGNRRYGEKVLREMLREGTRGGKGTGLLFADIDGFKEVNDRYGHSIGDVVLKNISRTLSGNVRNDDTVCRWGGEEFIVMLSWISSSQLLKIAEKLRILISRSHLFIGNDMLSVTVSIGATLSRSGDRVASMIKRADRLMYDSKRSGKNRVSSDQ